MHSSSAPPAAEPCLQNTAFRPMNRCWRPIIEPLPSNCGRWSMSCPSRLGHSVLDMACGDGVYSPWLAERVGSGGRVVAVDMRTEYLELARKQSACSPFSGIIEFLAASIESLPLEDESFDLCWCAQSLYSLPDPVQALQHMRRVTRPGGVVAVLEGDSFHHIILPWPVELELSVRAAKASRHLAQKSDQPGKYYVGRQLRRVFREAGLERIVTWHLRD